ncbi:hypothetical protein JEQ12_005650 [Ovis aries]|uniref:Uncharacterized protein n=1 Tax=Ovis aries TaxID=9940 RepID=A0A836CXE0_SHEEP|nr:hypothetical protein JEQ12_005650 [Ovis aries]
MFGRAETYETKDFFLRKIQETVHGFESLWTAAERNGKGMSVSHNRNLTGGRDHQSRNDVGDKPVEMHRSSFHDELQMLQSEGTVSECSQVVTNINSSTSDVSHIHMTKKLQAKANSGKGEILQTVMFGRAETHEIKDFFLRKIEETVHGFECLWTDDERSDIGVSISHNKNLTDGKDHQSRNDAADKPVERLWSSFHDELQMLQSEGTIFECSQIVTNINSSTSVLPIQRTCSVRKGISFKHESPVMRPSEQAPDQEAYKKKSYKTHPFYQMFLLGKKSRGGMEKREYKQLESCRVPKLKSSENTYSEKAKGFATTTESGKYGSTMFLSCDFGLCSGEETAAENKPFFINKVKKQSDIFCALRKQAACELSMFQMQTVHMDVDRFGVTLKRFGPDTWGKVFMKFQEEMY